MYLDLGRAGLLRRADNAGDFGLGDCCGASAHAVPLAARTQNSLRYLLGANQSRRRVDSFAHREYHSLRRLYAPMWPGMQIDLVTFLYTWHDIIKIVQ